MIKQVTFFYPQKLKLDLKKKFNTVSAPRRVKMAKVYSLLLLSMGVPHIQL